MAIITNVAISPSDFTTVPYTPAIYEEQTQFEGAVLRVNLHTYQVMSDVWEDGFQALVWDADLNKSRTVNGILSGVPDATSDVKAKYFAEQAKMRADSRMTSKLKDDAAARTKIEKGDIVRVVRGKTAKMLVGPVVVSIFRAYAKGWQASTELKFAIALDDTTAPVVASNGKTYMNHTNVAWVWARNCEKVVVAPSTLNLDYTAIFAQEYKDVEREFVRR